MKLTARKQFRIVGLQMNRNTFTTTKIKLKLHATHLDLSNDPLASVAGTCKGTRCKVQPFRKSPNSARDYRCRANIPKISATKSLNKLC